MIRRSYTTFTALALAASCLAAPGCGSKNDHVEIDSNKTVHPKTPEQIQAIQNNPRIPAHLKAMMLGRSGAPPTAKKGGAGQTKP